MIPYLHLRSLYRLATSLIKDVSPSNSGLLSIGLLVLPVLLCVKVQADDSDEGSYRFQRHYSADMRGTDQYDLTRLVEYSAVIQNIIFPEKGIAQIRFSDAADPETTHIADIQVVSSLRLRGLNKNLLQRGEPVQLIGWPSTYKNKTGSVLLVHQISWGDQNRKIVFHENVGVAPR